MFKKYIIYSILFSINLVALGISFTFFLYSYIPDSYKQFNVYRTLMWSSSGSFDISQDEYELAEFIESFSRANNINIFLEANSRGILYYSGDSDHLMNFVDVMNPEFLETTNTDFIFVGKDSPLLNNFAEDYVISGYNNDITIAGIIDNDKNPYLFRERSDGDLIIPITSEYMNSDYVGRISLVYVPLEYAVEFNESITGKFPNYEIWALGPKMEGIVPFLARVLSETNQANYLILTLSLLVSTFYLIFYFFKTIKPELRVHYYYGLSTTRAYTILNIFHLFIFIISLILVVSFSYNVRFYSVVTWQNVYLPLFFILLLLLSVVLPSVLTWRMNRNLEINDRKGL